jgi:hypothetical protein
MRPMSCRQRLMATLRGEAVDRPPVCFYEINGLDEDPDDPDPFNIFNHPSWRPLIELARERTDRIVMRGAVFKEALPDPLEGFTTLETWEESSPNGLSRFTRRTIRVGSRSLSSLTRRDQELDTVWTLEHLLKDADDLRLFLELPTPQFSGQVDPENVLAAEAALGESGIVMLDTPDPLCLAASLFHLGDYTVAALTEPGLFTCLLDRFAALLYPQVEAVARALPGRLWRIYGPEYASPPYLPPSLFRAYVVNYVRPMVHSIQSTGGFARLHCHGKVGAILDDIAGLGVDGLDPVEPPPQGDITLTEARQRVGEQLVLFGNIEVAEIETLPPGQFEKRVRQALAEGTAGRGRGFVLMPTACPIGRALSLRALENYTRMVAAAENWTQEYNAR